jgi:MFS family permease
MFFFAYFAGLIGLQMTGAGLEWLARPPSLLPAYGMVTAGLVALPFGESSIALVSVRLVCGVSHGVLMSVLYALLLFEIPRDRRGWAVAFLAAAFDLGNVHGPAGFGLVAETLDYRGIIALATGAVVEWNPVFVLRVLLPPRADARVRPEDEPEDCPPTSLQSPSIPGPHSRRSASERIHTRPAGRSRPASAPQRSRPACRSPTG